jgi:hypothetical protein
MPEDEPKPEAEDVVLLHGPTDDGEGVRVIRSRTGRPLESGEVRAMKDGKPLMGAEVVSLKPRPGAPELCDVEVVAQPRADPKPAATKTEGRGVTHGPAQVASEAYRTSWERIFGGTTHERKGAPN